MSNSNKNTDFSFKELDAVVLKTQQMAEMWKLCQCLTGEQEYGPVIKRLKEIVDSEATSDRECPPRFLIGKTGPQCKIICNAWKSVLKQLSEEMGDFEFGRTVKKLQQKDSIDEIYYFMDQRKISHTDVCVEKTGRQFKNSG